MAKKAVPAGGTHIAMGSGVPKATNRVVSKGTFGGAAKGGSRSGKGGKSGMKGSKDPC